jgi:hypothetical protein
MMPQSQLNFDKSDLVRSKIKKIQESLLHVKPKGIIHQRFFFYIEKFRLYMCLNSSEKLTLMDLSLWSELNHLQKLTYLY